jgi:hypothetical protein
VEAGRGEKKGLCGPPGQENGLVDLNGMAAGARGPGGHGSRKFPYIRILILFFKNRLIFEKTSTNYIL